MKFTCISIVLFFSATIQSNAQNLDQRVLASSGQALSNSTGSITFTIAEPITSTMTNSTGTLNNGFHQGSLVVTNITEAIGNISFKVYPNPTTLNVTVENTQNGSTLVELFDSKGQLLIRKNFIEMSEVINLSSYADGTYFLKLNQHNTYKIIKTQNH
ncbi:MAG: hypothetical protein K0S53_2305 [Bacteroidetes bacterium]|jgi:hypothetical protein|nr:hypothetical protein [Bacteroidota bacterium]MDF2450554.1 hypothetical protein [Bacteroidota bacterium]